MELLRDRRADFEAAGVQPIGISRDAPRTHIAWTQALDLNFGLLSDFNGDATRALGIAFDFRGFRDVSHRSAFLVDATGTIRGSWRDEPGEAPDMEVLLGALKLLTASDDPAWAPAGNPRPLGPPPGLGGRRP